MSSSSSPLVSIEHLDLTHLFPHKKDAFALVIDGLLSETECQQLINRAETIGFDEAKVGASQNRDEGQRNNWRLLLDDKELASDLFQRIKPHVPQKWLQCSLVGLNERWRVLKYNPGEYFKPHHDGVYVRPDESEQSFLTLHLYLNDVPEGDGGETTFTTERMTYGRHVMKQQHENKNNDTATTIKHLRVRPVTGRALLFEHHLPHEGSTLMQGTKYTMRTDVMYAIEKGRKPQRGPRWSSAFPHPQYE